MIKSYEMTPDEKLVRAEDLEAEAGRLRGRVPDVIKWRPCPKCKGDTQFRMDPESGQYLVTFVSSCPTKEECTDRIIREAGYEPA